MNNSASPSTRIGFLDATKAFAILLVVWGHIIQQNINNCFDNSAFSFIYSFHMPLFFILSGMFLGKQFERSFIGVIKKRGIQLLLPAFSVLMLFSLVSLAVGKITTVKAFMVSALLLPWFINTLFSSDIFAWLSHKIFKKDWVACILSILLLFALPNVDIMGLKTFLPFVWCGYFFMKHHRWIFAHAHRILCVVLPLFIVLLCFWTTDYTVYKAQAVFYTISISQDSIVFNADRVFAYIYRFFIGVSGSLSVILMMKLLYEKIQCLRSPLVRYIGASTLGIYLIQIGGGEIPL